MGIELEAKDADIFSGCGNGTLDVAIQHKLDEYGKSWDENKGDRWLHICINDEDLVSISTEMFHFVVGRLPKIEPYVYRNWEDSATQIISAFPMLNRIEEMYADALYYADEVDTLREECVKLKLFTTDKAADLGLRKLIYCCDEALKAGLSIGLWCD